MTVKLEMVVRPTVLELYGHNTNRYQLHESSRNVVGHFHTPNMNGDGEYGFT